MSSTSTQPTGDSVVFPTHLSPIGIFFCVVPALVIVFAVLSIALQRPPIILMLLLIAVLGCCCALLKAAIDEMGAITVEWSSQGITIRRLLGTDSYYWSHIEQVEMYDPGATFGDRGRHEEKRVAIGLYIRDPAKKNRTTGAPPDVMVVSRAGEAGEKIPKLTERLANARRYGGGRDSRKIGSQQSGGSGRQTKQFRRTASNAA